MKMNSTMKLGMLSLAVMLSIGACKKKDGIEPQPQPVEVKTVTITELKTLSTGASVKVPDGRKFKGIVISDAFAKNIDAKTLILQEATDKPAIIVTFDTAPTFAMGDEVEVVASNQTLAQVNGEIVLQNVPAANAKKTGTGTITARATTIADINTNKASWNGALVSITATELSSTNGKYTGALTVKDATGTMGSTVLAGASFENTNLPASVSKLTGIVRLNAGNAQLIIRNNADVVAGAITGVITDSFEDLKDLKGVIFTTTNLDIMNEFGDGFLTKVGKWAKTEQYTSLFLLKGNFYDDGFLAASRNYLYMPIGGQRFIGFDHIASNYSNNAGLRSVAITFAGTTAKSVQFGKNSPINQLGFDSADSLAIGVLPVLPGNKNLIGSSEWGTVDYLNNGNDLLPEEYDVLYKLLKISSSFKTTGQWHTFEYIIPTKQELISAGVSSQNADLFIANPQIRIYNRSSIYRKPVPVDLGPIIFDKVVFKYGN